MVQERDDYILGFQADLSGLRTYLASLRTLPNAVEQIAAKVTNANFGGGQVSATQGKKLATTILRAFENELKGGSSFERTLRQALGRLDFGIPQAQLSRLRQQLGEINRLQQGASSPLRRPFPPPPLPSTPPPAPAAGGAGAGGPRRPIPAPPAPAPGPLPTPANGTRDDQIRLLLARLKEVTAEELARERIARRIFEIERGITGALERASAINRRVGARLTSGETLSLAEQQLARRQTQALQTPGESATLNENRRIRQLQQVLELNQGITQSLQAQAAATRRIGAQLTPQQAEVLARQNLQRRQQQAAIPGDRFRLIEEAAQARTDANATRQGYRNQGGLVGAARAASISPDGSTSAEQFFRTARGVTAFTATAFPLYAAMNLVTQGLREATQGTLEYEDSLSKLGVSLNADKSGLRGFASEIGSVANGFGYSQDKGIEAAARGVGAFGIGPDSGLGRQEQEDFLRRAVKTAGQINYQSGTKDLVSTQQNVAGTLRSFNLANDQIEEVADSTTVISKRFGVLASDLLNTTAQIGTQAQAAGFTLPQTQAIIANQSKNTGQTPDAVAGFFSQVLAQADSTNVTRRLRGVGVDTDNTTMAQQIEQLAKLVADGQISQARLNDVSSAFGRGRSSQALQILVRDFAKIQTAATDAQNSPGASQKIFEQLFNNISAEFRKFVGNLRGIITELTQSGLLDFLGLLLIGAEKLSSVVYELLQVFNQIPRPLRTVGFFMLELALALKLIARFGGVAKLLRDVGGAMAATFNVFRTAQAGQAAATAGAVGANAAASGTGVPFAGRRGGVIRTLNTPLNRLGPEDFRVLGRGAAGAGAAGAARAGAGASSALAAIGGVPGATALVAALVVAGTFKAIQAHEETNRAVDRANSSSNRATTAEELRAAAAAQREAADKARVEQRGGFNLRTIGTLGIAPLLANTLGSQEQQVADAKRKAAELEAAAKKLDEQKAGTTGTAAGFNGFQSADDVKKAFENLDAAGFSASQQLALVGDAMDSLTEKAGTTAAAIIPDGDQNKFANAFGSLAARSVQEAIDQAKNKKDSFVFLNPLPGSDYNQSKDSLSALQGIDTNALRDATTANVQSYLTGIGKSGSGEQSLTSQELKDLEKAQYEFIKARLDPQMKNLPEALRKTLLTSIQVYTRRDIEGSFGTAANGASISPDTINNALSATQQAASKVFDEQSKYTKLGATQGQRDTLKQAIRDAQKQQLTLTGKDFTDAGRYISLAQDQLALINKDLATQLSDFAAGKAKLRLLKGRGDDSAALLAAQIAAVKASRKLATDPKEQQDLDIQLAELRNQQRKAALGLTTAQAGAGRDPRNLSGSARDAVAAARRGLRDAKANGGPLEVAQAQSALNEAIAQQRDTALAINKSKAAAGVRIGDAVAAAQVALSNAKLDLASTKKGQAAYYDALVAVGQARKEAAAALNQRKYNRDLLGIDLTDPVAQANADVRDARRQLADAQGPDDRDAARLNLRNKRNSAEAAAFSQRLSDVQTADDLGRISHEAYLHYLQNEHNRLSAIGKRTRQQQDELDQIDKLMKGAADELNGQFNIGTIKLPTVYEVRRAIAAGSSGVGNIAKFQTAQNQVSIDNSVRTVTLNGVSFEQVAKYLQTILGSNPTKTSSTGGR